MDTPELSMDSPDPQLEMEAASSSSSIEENAIQNINFVKNKEQKRRPKPRDGTVLKCGVCGDRALGYNFDAITCESCKAFFRRNASKNKTFHCSFEGNCKLDAHTRKFCSGCRLKKCLNIGMKKDWILDENQLAKRREKLRTSQDHPQLHSTEDSHGSCEVTTNYTSDEVSSSFETPGDGAMFKVDNTDEDVYLKPLPTEVLLNLQAIESTYTSIFDAPYDLEAAAKIASVPENANDLFNLTDFFIRRLIKFGKVLPEFKDFTQEDQIHILKGGIMEIFVLRSAMSFDKNIEKWKYSDVDGKKQLDPKIIASMSSTMYSSHIQFVKSLHELISSDRYILLLLFIIELFSPDRPNIVNKELVSTAQEKYSCWLKAYIESIHPIGTARVLYPKILMKLTEVRNLGEESAKLAMHLDITKLLPLEVEIFNLQ